MENDTQNIEQKNNTETFPLAKKADGTKGQVMAAVATLVVIAGLAYYLTAMNAPKQDLSVNTNTQPEQVAVIPAPSTDPQNVAEDTAIVALSTQSSSDEIDTIEADINATDLDAVMEYIDQI